jgi:hypothetical protein
MAGIYNFFRGISGKLGTGVSDLGFERSSSIPLTPLNGPGVFVRRALGPTAPGFVITDNRMVPVVTFNGTTGQGLHGTPQLQRLAKKG